MSETPKNFLVPADAGDSRLWYPLPPRWMPLLRVFGVLSLLFVIYRTVVQQPWSWSWSSLSRWSVPAIFVFWCLFIRPELRAPTALHRIGRAAHLLLVFLVLPLALLVLILYGFRA